MLPVALVINPWITDFKLYDEWMHPVGLYFLISLLLRNGYDVRFFNCLGRDGTGKSKKYGTGDFPFHEIEKPALYRSIPRKYKLYGRPRREFEAFLSDCPEPQAVFVGSMMTYWLPGVAETIKVLRAIHPASPLYIGGIAARLMPSAIKNMAPDAVVCGPLSEQSLPWKDSLARPFAVHEPLSMVEGLRIAGKQFHGTALLSLGCPMSCSYCASSRLNGNFRFRPLDLVKKEILLQAADFGIVDFAFQDDALLYDAGNGLRPLLQSIMEQPIGPLRFHTPNGLHLRFVDPPLLELIAKAGFVTLRFGYETGSAAYFRDTSAKACREQLSEKISLVKKAGFDPARVGIYVMAGLEGQLPRTVLEEMDFVASLGVKVKPVFFSPVPGTPLFERYARRFPQLRGDPLWHNDVFFPTQIDEWNWDATELIRTKAREVNFNEEK